jgi:surface antigen
MVASQHVSWRWLKLAAGPLCAALVLSASGAFAEPRYEMGPDCPPAAGLIPADGVGIVVGGRAGDAVALGIACPDRVFALRTFVRGLEGPIGRKFVWSNPARSSSGSFRVSWEFESEGLTCRDFAFESHVRGQRRLGQGTACRKSDGNWHLR